MSFTAFTAVLKSFFYKPNIPHNLQGKDFPLTSKEYIVPVKTSGGIKCLSAFTPLDIPSKVRCNTPDPFP